ncbi:FtsX-like permease family protein [Peptostreptococcus faecalis]|uniref:FtsX-like permease family protein n=1 Tax=Peptostreptococcus faecalis TaxID=2045015 RepID=UPI0015E09ABF|nr:ABC transporter permease [Peptostreptococcus faecalis]
MKSFNDVYKELRKKNKNQYILLATCTFMSVLLITAYLTMINSDTILNMLPEGGDSRKQVTMIFALAVIGCIVFVNYALGLFLRYKSRESGVLMALGASKKQIKTNLVREVVSTVIISSLLGIVLGSPLAWTIWQLFRTFVVNSEEMVLAISLKTPFLAAAYSIILIIITFFRLNAFIKRTNIIDVVNESKKSEPIKNVPKWYGIAGIILMIVGAFLGLKVPSIIITELHYYPPEFLTAPLYIPLFIGLYMVMLHTVVNGWKKSKNKYKNIISNSIMKFEGRQTVRNMLVITLLVAGGYFASFYVPMMNSGISSDTENRTADYSFHYRLDQNMVEKEDIHNLAKKHNVTITDYISQPFAVLAVDGDDQIERENSTYYYQYRETLRTKNFLSESAYNKLTGEKIDLKPGTITVVHLSDGTFDDYIAGNDTLKVTNLTTGKVLDVAPVDNYPRNNLLYSYKILDDSDYNEITAGLENIYLENQIFFNVLNVEKTYPFAKELFNEIVDHSNSDVEVHDSWDPLAKKRAQDKGEPYFLDNETLISKGEDPLSFEKKDSFDFRNYWKYMPKFRILDQTDFLKSSSVFLMLFVFISIICFAAVAVIAYTRSITIGLNNSHVFENLKRLGANNDYLRKVAKSQISKVFIAPTSVGTISILLFYLLILYNNDETITPSEISAIASILGIISVITLLIYVLYRFVYVKVCKILCISAKKDK